MKKQTPPVVLAPHMLDFISHSATQTERIGQRLGEQLGPGDVLLLSGTLGVGKTQLVKGIALGCGSPDLVTSPSFVLMNEYRTGPDGRGPRLYHGDLYRLADPAELTSIGLEELWHGLDICVIEWADRAVAWLPAAHLAIELRHLDETKRVLRFVPHGAHYEKLVAAFKEAAFGG